MNDAFRRFLEAFNQPPMGVPMATPPWMNSFPATPMGSNPQSASVTH